MPLNMCRIHTYYILYEIHAKLLALLAHVVRPDRGLDFSDMPLMQQHHTESALSDTASDAQGQLVAQQLLMEVQLLALFLVRQLQLPEQALLIHTDTHR